MSLNSNIPRELIQKLAENKCDAFIGAGLSAGAGLPFWGELLQQMIEWSVVRHIPLSDRAELDRLIAEKDFLPVADEMTDRMGDTRFREFMTSVFRRANLGPTETHRLLPEIPFAALLTTNYDKLVESAYTVATSGISVPTFTPLDGPELAGALQADEFHILKTHGTIDRIDSIVLSRNQYRRLIHDNPKYKIYMQQTLMSKSVLFLGFSLTDPDLLLLLDELRVFFRDDTPPHFALMDKTRLSPVRAERFRRDYNINVIEYEPSAPSHPEVAEFLRELINRTPKKFYRNLERAKRELENLDSHYKIVATTESEFVVKEKFPGAAAEKPIPFDFTLAFDAKTESGRAAKEAWENFVKTGETTTLSDPHVQNLKLPDILSKLVNFVPESLTMTVSTYRTGEKFIVRLAATASDGGAAATIDNIELEKTAQGEELVTLNNNEQNHFFRVSFVWELKNEVAKVSFNYDRKGVTVYQALIAERFLAALAKGGNVVIEFMNSGMPLGTATLPAGCVAASEPLFIEVLEALMLIQQKVSVAFDVPYVLAAAEAENILEAARIIRTGKDEKTASATVEVERKFAERILTGSGGFAAQQSAEAVYFIQGQRVSLGTAWSDCDNLILTDEEKSRLQKQLEETDDDERRTYTIKVTSPPDAPAMVYYLNFLPDSELERLFGDPRFREFTLNDILNLLFDAATAEDGTINFSALVSSLTEAAAQTTNAGKPLNMLRRSRAEELAAALNPLLPRLAAKKARDLISELVRLDMIGEDDAVKFSV